jgi:hypothetical protein
MKLSTDFAQTFESLPDDIEFHVDKWKEVRKLLILITHKIRLVVNRFVLVIILKERLVINVQMHKECIFLPSPDDFFYYYLVCEAIGTAATPGISCQPRVIVKMIVE